MSRPSLQPGGDPGPMVWQCKTFGVPERLRETIRSTQKMLTSVDGIENIGGGGALRPLPVCRADLACGVRLSSHTNGHYLWPLVLCVHAAANLFRSRGMLFAWIASGARSARSPGSCSGRPSARRQGTDRHRLRPDRQSPAFRPDHAAQLKTDTANIVTQVISTVVIKRISFAEMLILRPPV